MINWTLTNGNFLFHETLSGEWKDKSENASKVTNYIFNIGFVSKIYEELSKLIIRVKNEQSILIDTINEDIYISNEPVKE